MVIFILMFAALSTMVAAASLALIIGVSLPWRSLAPRHPNGPSKAQVISPGAGWSERALSSAAILTDTDQEGFLQVWDSVRSRFASDPRTAVSYADLLMSDILGDSARGGLDCSRSGLNPETANKYRRAHEIANRSRLRDSAPDELALAMSLYGAVLEEALVSQRRERRIAH